MIDLDTQLREYIEGIAAPVPSPAPERLAARVSVRRERRGRWRVAVGIAAVILIVVVVFALRPQGNDHAVRTHSASIPTSTMSNVENGVAWTLPDSWQASSLVATDVTGGDVSSDPTLLDMSAVELLAAGTAPRPAGLSSVVCGDAPPDLTQAFVSIREYPADRAQGLPARPDTLGPTDATTTTLPYCQPTPPGVDIQRVTFTDHGRAFLVYVVIGAQATNARRDDAWAIVNSLQVATLSPASTSEAAQITTAFEHAIDIAGADPSLSRTAIEHADLLPDGVREQVASLNQGAPRIELHDIRVHDQTSRVRYRIGYANTDLNSDLNAVLSGYGYATHEDGTWKVTLDTACQWITTLGLDCPATTPTT